jgi:hypothetical protein
MEKAPVKAPWSDLYMTVNSPVNKDQANAAALSKMTAARISIPYISFISSSVNSFPTSLYRKTKKRAICSARRNKYDKNSGI